MPFIRCLLCHFINITCWPRNNSLKNISMTLYYSEDRSWNLDNFLFFFFFLISHGNFNLHCPGSKDFGYWYNLIVLHISVFVLNWNLARFLFFRVQILARRLAQLINRSFLSECLTFFSFLCSWMSLDLSTDMEANPWKSYRWIGSDRCC